MSPTLAAAWGELSEKLSHDRILANTLKAILELRGAPVLRVSKATGATPQDVLGKFRELEGLRLVEGDHKDDAFEAYFRMSPIALQFQSDLWSLLK